MPGRQVNVHFQILPIRLAVDDVGLGPWQQRRKPALDRLCGLLQRRLRRAGFGWLRSREREGRDAANDGRRSRRSTLATEIVRSWTRPFLPDAPGLRHPACPARPDG